MPRVLDAAAVGALPWAVAVDALEAALVSGFDPEHDAARSRIDVAGGELLLMPSRLPDAIGTKLLTVGPGNPARGLPLVQGVYVLFDPATLAPMAVLDGAALTARRTPAVSALAARHLARPGARRLTVFGTGVQARGHVAALLATSSLREVDVVAARPDAAASWAQELRAHGVVARAVLGEEALAQADVVVCATTSPDPLFSGDRIAEDALVIAIGAHTPTTREVDDTLVGRAQVVVESRDSALRENGDVIAPVHSGVIAEANLATLASLVSGAVKVDRSRPRLFTGTGMPWQDLVVAAAL